MVAKQWAQNPKQKEGILFKFLKKRQEEKLSVNKSDKLMLTVCNMLCRKINDKDTKLKSVHTRNNKAIDYKQPNAIRRFQRALKRSQTLAMAAKYSKFRWLRFE